VILPYHERVSATRDILYNQYLGPKMGKVSSFTEYLELVLRKLCMNAMSGNEVSGSKEIGPAFRLYPSQKP
jgi:hypothetical protein